tara:strand:+ start:1340 stop:1876 length:537 start_codon:yes stop_codon:yes gene_type:complete
MKRVLLATALVFVFASCKNEKKEIDISNTKVEKVESKSKTLTIDLTVQYALNDNIWLFYTEDFEAYKYEVKNAIQKSIKGNEDFQTISFEIPEDVYPQGIKFLFSNNKSQKTMALKNIKIHNGKKEFIVDSSNFVSFFNFSKFIDTADGSVIELIEVDGIYDPNIVSSSQLNNEIVKF